MHDFCYNSTLLGIPCNYCKTSGVGPTCIPIMSHLCCKGIKTSVSCDVQPSLQVGLVTLPRDDLMESIDSSSAHRMFHFSLLTHVQTSIRLNALHSMLTLWHNLWIGNLPRCRFVTIFGVLWTVSTLYPFQW